MGTPDFAVGVLRKLIDTNFNVVGVVTAPDRPSGRGRKLNQSAVKKYAIEQNLPVLQPTNLKSELFLSELKQLNANLQIVVAFRMLPKVVWQLPDLGTFNLHASLLPNYRGAAPINWAIINGETRTGVTTFFIDDKIDTGAIILKEELAIDKNDTAGSLHDKLMVLGSELVVKTVKEIEKGNVKTIQQTKLEQHQLKEAPKIFKETCKIDWNNSMDAIFNKIRGLNPYPGAWTFLHNNNQSLEMKIYNVSKEKENHTHPIGKLIVGKSQLKVAVNEGYISIEELQLPGKRKMKIGDLLNGYSFDINSYVFN
ncbi:methionyl-tRNA formyltransferase [Aureibaculum marinum]|uniref:Methionyl-tRNA formyltransferase n=2 Tax=Aureibaculum marinum TaxID=2487930 RepID=A0A3N4NXZ2_9FLAO|nr:methionyl-tRNA formyltransferase [Aureibaculum marinum]